MNYIILFPDEMRAESLSCYGHPLIETPHIDELAAEGTLFRNNYTANPVCVASRCSLLTGCYPHVFGHRSQFNLLEEREPNFIARLGQEGYTTALIGKDDCFTPEARARVFTEYWRLPQRRQKALEKGNHYNMILPPQEDEDSMDEVVAQQTIEFIQKHSADAHPFVAWVNFFAPHPPYTCPSRWYYHYADKDIPPQRTMDWLSDKPSLYRFCREYRLAQNEDPEVFVRMNAIYLGMISYIDELVGRIVQALKDAGIYEDTTIIFCSDHGDFAGDAGLCEKCPNGMDEMLTRVPLIIRRPGAAAGHEVAELTQSIDIFPTIFDMEGLAVGFDQFGLSLKQQVQGASGDADRVVYCEGGYDTREPQCFETLGAPDSPVRKIMGEGTIYYPKMMHQEEQPQSVCRTLMRRDPRYKIVVRTDGEHEMYDMAEDPLEYHNLYGQEQYKALFQEKCMDALLWLIHTSDVSSQQPNTPPWFVQLENERKKKEAEKKRAADLDARRASQTQREQQQ